VDFVTREQLPLVVLLILPGFISTKVFDLLVPGEARDAGRQVLEAMTYGLLNFGLWYVVLADVLLPVRDSAPWVFRLGIVGIFVVSPILLAVLVNAVLRWRGLHRWVRHPIPTAWDFFFWRRQPGWVLIRLKSGLLLGGLFGPESFASSYPHRDLYVQETWHLDENGQFLSPVPQSKGVLVSMADCETLEFFAWSDEPQVVNHARENGAANS
jgi:hypothetical protein